MVTSRLTEASISTKCGGMDNCLCPPLMKADRKAMRENGL